MPQAAPPSISSKTTPGSPSPLTVAAAGKSFAGTHRSVRVFQNLTFEVRPFETVVLLGASGCGKSSLLKAVAGLLPLDEGEIRILGRTVLRPDLAAGFVFQEPVLLPWLDVAANVDFSLSLHHSPRLTLSERKERVASALDDVGLSKAGRARVHQLSGGMAQRVALARVLVRKPSLLLLDEPFGALDAITRTEMQRLLLQVVSTHRAAALLVTHDLDEALLLADRILLMGPNPGHIVAAWTIDAPHPRFERMKDLAPLRSELLAALSRTLAAA